MWRVMLGARVGGEEVEGKCMRGFTDGSIARASGKSDRGRDVGKRSYTKSTH